MAVKRALGALYGLALGDALGMPTQTLSPGEIKEQYGVVRGLTQANDRQPVAPNMPAGAITDDTEQALILAELLIEGAGRIEAEQLAHRLLRWEDSMRVRGSMDLLGPSTKTALEKVRAGEDPLTTGKEGTTNGASMRVAPVGIAHSVDSNRSQLADAVYDSCLVTHNTHQGWHAALLIACAVSSGVDGASPGDALATSLSTVARLNNRGAWTPKASVLARTIRAMEMTQGLSEEEFVNCLRTEVGTSVESSESVAATFAIVQFYAQSPYKGLLVAANLGGDTDTIGAMAGAIFGACGGRAVFPPEELHLLQRVSDLNLEPLADRLVAIRRQS